uniref:CD164 sialomucin-like 2 n=1 Tax=Cyprinus carpio TaxID=7962 RepID=A0A8C1ULP5_CYPCA
DDFLRMRCVWAALCGTVLLMQVIITNSQTSDSSTGDCSQFDSCNGCINGDSALNLTRCVWQSCNDGKRTHVAYEFKYSGGCSVYNETGMYTTPGSGPDFSQASFDLSSFIGGIILVLVLQAGAFFAMRFLKTKDSSYETM